MTRFKKETGRKFTGYQIVSFKKNVIETNISHSLREEGAKAPSFVLCKHFGRGRFLQNINLKPTP